MFRKIKERFEKSRFGDVWDECLWVGRYIVRYKGSVSVHILLGVIGIIMTLASSVASKFLIDAVISYDSGIIGAAAAAMIGMRIGNIVMKSISARVGAVIDIRIQNEIQHEIYESILHAEWQSIEKFRSGDLLDRISGDCRTVSGAVTGFVPSLISSGVQFFGAFLIMLYYDPIMAVIALIGVPVTGICSAFLIRKMRRNSREMKESYSEVVSFQQESFQNMTAIKSFGAAESFGTKMFSVQKAYKDKFLEYSKFSVLTSALMSFLNLAAYIGCFGWGVYRLWMGQISYGEMTLFMQLSVMLGAAFSSIIGLVPGGISVTTSARRVMSVTELPEEKNETEEGFDEEESYTVLLKGIGFGYDEGAKVLEKVDFTAKPGEIVSVTGPSGKGKTTLLRIMLGLVNPKEGSAEIIGSSGKGYSVSAATRKIFGYVPQENRIFAGTVAENLRVTNPEATEEEMYAALRAACAFDFVSEYPDGLEHRVGGRDKRLSEGQAQRLAVARAILKKAPILLLDEATSALDMETEARMLKNLMESNMVKTCVFVTHRSAGKDICSRNYRIENKTLREEE